MERPDYETSIEEYTEMVEGERAEASKPMQAEIVNDVIVKDFPPRSWSGSQWPVDALSVQQIASHLPQRTTLFVRNTSVDKVVYLASERESCTANSGFILSPGAMVTFHHTAAVFATCGGTDTATVTTYGEFRDGGQ